MFRSRLAVVLLILSAPVTAAANMSERLVFDVFLDDKQIGTHSYEFVRAGDSTVVSSNAQFDVKFLFITAYKYRHTVTERWNNGCLSYIDAETTANGKRRTVDGRSDAGVFAVEQGDSLQRLDECVMTFAYWNPDFLEQARLLNPQTGEYLPVEVTEVDVAGLDAARTRLGSSAYRISAKGLKVTVWYSASGDWVGLESEAKGGRILRYEIA